jgi:hypothetical protein
VTCKQGSGADGANGVPCMGDADFFIDGGTLTIFGGPLCRLAAASTMTTKASTTTGSALISAMTTRFWVSVKNWTFLPN